MASTSSERSHAANQQVNQNPTQRCPYHGPVLALQQVNRSSSLTPMQRFLSEGGSEQGAVFLRADNNQVSIKKNCTCIHDTNGRG